MDGKAPTVTQNIWNWALASLVGYRNRAAFATRDLWAYLTIIVCSKVLQAFSYFHTLERKPLYPFCALYMSGVFPVWYLRQLYQPKVKGSNNLIIIIIINALSASSSSNQKWDKWEAPEPLDNPTQTYEKGNKFLSQKVFLDIWLSPRQLYRWPSRWLTNYY